MLVGLGLAGLAASLVIGLTAGSASGTEPRLSWYICTQGGVVGRYEDANCTTEGGIKQYGWLRGGTNILSTSSIGSYKLGYSFAGVVNEIVCNKATGTGYLKNTATGARTEGYTLNLDECGFTAPSGKGCTISEGKITLHLTGTSPESPEALVPVLKVGVDSGASYYVEGCAPSYSFLNGSNSVTGYFPAQIHNGESRMSTTKAESNGLLQIRGNPASIDGQSSITATTGARAVKLDTKG
jgi:hypothetical protein